MGERACGASHSFKDSLPAPLWCWLHSLQEPRAVERAGPTQSLHIPSSWWDQDRSGSWTAVWMAPLVPGSGTGSGKLCLHLMLSALPHQTIHRALLGELRIHGKMRPRRHRDGGRSSSLLLKQLYLCSRSLSSPSALGDKRIGLCTSLRTASLSSLHGGEQRIWHPEDRLSPRRAGGLLPNR